MDGGLKIALAAGQTIAIYPSVEIDADSRAIAQSAISKLQADYSRQLPDSAIRGCTKRLPHDIRHFGARELSNLIAEKGEIQYLCAGWQCQSMSMAGKHEGMDASSNCDWKLFTRSRALV